MQQTIWDKQPCSLRAWLCRGIDSVDLATTYCQQGTLTWLLCMQRWGQMAWWLLSWVKTGSVSPFPASFPWSLVKWLKCVLNKYLQTTCVFHLLPRKKRTTLLPVSSVMKMAGQLWIYSKLQAVWQLQVSSEIKLLLWKAQSLEAINSLCCLLLMLTTGK